MDIRLTFHNLNPVLEFNQLRQKEVDALWTPKDGVHA